MPSGEQIDITRAVLKGVGLTSLIFFISVYIPIFGFFFALFIPLPVIFYRAILGRKYGALVPAISAIIMGFMLGKVSFDMLFFAGLLLLGFTLSDLIEKNLSIEKTVLYTCIIVISVSFICLIFYSNASSIDIVTLVSNYVSENLRMTMVLYEKMGVSNDNLQIFLELQDVIHYALVRIIPSLVISSVLFVTWITLLMAKPVLKTRRLFYPDFGSLNLWKPPEFLVWGVIGCGLMLLLPDKTIKMMGFNGLIILMTIYFFGGIAIISYYFEKKQVPLMLRFFLYSLITLWQVVLFLVIGLGFFDIWLNFRKLEIKKE